MNFSKTNALDTIFYSVFVIDYVIMFFMFLFKILLQKHGFANVNLQSLHFILSRNNGRSAFGKEQVLIRRELCG